MTIAYLTHPDCLLHNPGVNHPECAQRLTVIADQLIASGLDPLVIHQQAPLATREQLERVHTQDYISQIFQSAPTYGFLGLDEDTVMNSHTLSAALHAAGAVVKAVDMVMSREVTKGFCGIRPPGHHAERSKAMGFCFFNNLAVGVAHAIACYAIKRVVIVDFDAHQGNGTEDIFKNNKKVLICSIFEPDLYPFPQITSQASNVINVLLPPGATSKEIRAEVVQHAFDRIEAFSPELLFFSAGFDGYKQDAMSDLNFNENDYFWLTQQMKQIAESSCQGRIISVLEGGYDLPSLGRCVVEHLKALQ